MNSDDITKLPVDKIELNSEDTQIVDQLFGKNKKNIDGILNELKLSILAGVLFGIFSFPLIDKLIQSILPITKNSDIILLIIKVIIFIVIFYFISNFYKVKTG